MLLTVSEIRDPINFSDLSDLVAIRFTTDICMKLTTMRKGVAARAMRPILQQCTKEIMRAQTTAVEFRVTTAKTPVIML